MQTATYQDISITYQDQLEYETLIEEIFKKRTYYVDLDNPTPLIIDAGAHIGMSMLYLHKLYPRATFVCIEPNPKNVKLLLKNSEDNGVENLTIIPKALVGKDGKESVTFYMHPQWSVFSSLHSKGWSGDQELTPVTVETIHLSEIITGHVDLLKMDIEGAEIDVLKEVGDKLRFVSHFILEFHETKKGQAEEMSRWLSTYFGHIEMTQDKRKEKNYEHRLYLIEAYKA